MPAKPHPHSAHPQDALSVNSRLVATLASCAELASAVIASRGFAQELATNRPFADALSNNPALAAAIAGTGAGAGGADMCIPPSTTGLASSSARCSYRTVCATACAALFPLTGSSARICNSFLSPNSSSCTSNGSELSLARSSIIFMTGWALRYDDGTFSSCSGT